MSVQSPLGALRHPETGLPRFLLQRVALLGDRPALVDGATGRTLSYAGFATLVRRCAAGLAERGFGRGDVLAILAANSPAWPVAALGAQLGGGAVTPVDTACGAEEIATRLRSTAARLVVTEAASADRVRGAGGSDVVVLDGAVPGTAPFAALLESGAPVPDARIDAASDPALLLWSSGTAGRPRAVRLTHRNLVSSTVQALALLRLAAEDVVVAATPFCSPLGYVAWMSAALRAGSTLVTPPRADLDTCLRLVEDYRATVLPAKPLIVRELARHPAVDRYDLSSLEFVACGGGPLPARLESACAARLNRPVLQVYGMAECPVVAVSDRDDAGRTPGAAGTLAPGAEARLLDPATGVEIGPGGMGELCFRGPQIMPGYLENAATAAIDSEGWLHTGDLGTVSGDGEVAVVDRLDDLITVSGCPLAPAELEALLSSHPAVADVAVVGRPDGCSGERPVAFVVERRLLHAEELIDWAARRTPGYQRLAEVVVVEAVPRTPSGTVLRHLLRRRLTASAHLPFGGPGSGDVLQHEMPR